MPANWDERGIDYPSRTTHHKHREETAYLLVEDTFRNSFYRFELNESPLVDQFVNDQENGPASYSVHLIGAIIDLTLLFKK